jgi:phosphomannomutase
LKGRTEKRVYYDLRFSRIIEDILKANKGKGIMMRVGNPFYKEKLKNEGGVFAAELSGHFMFQDHYCIDDGLYASLRFAKALLEDKKKLSELTKPLLAYYASPEINIKVKDADSVMKRVKAAFPNGTSIDIDGVFISYSDWWFNLRKSNTEPVVKLRLEAETPEKLEQMKTKLMTLIG